MMPVMADVIASLEWLFQVLLTGSIAGAGVIVAIAVICRLMPITPALRCTLWWLAALKLLIALVWVEPVVLRVLPPDTPSLDHPGSGVHAVRGNACGHDLELGRRDVLGSHGWSHR